MNTCHARKDGGFALITAMIILFVLTILVVNAVRSSSMNEQMAGSYMDRNRALQAAEQALRAGEAQLMTLIPKTNDPLCLQGCSVAGGEVVAATTGVTSIPAAWAKDPANLPTEDAPNQINFTITLTPDQTTTASYQIALLDDSLRDGGKADCKAYSIMGRGRGIDSRTVVILQTVAYVCPGE